MRHRRLIILPLILFLAASIQAQSFTERCGNESRRFSYAESMSDGGTTITLIAEDRVETCIVDSNSCCMEWSFRSIDGDRDFTAIRAPGFIRVSGTANGKKLERTIRIGDTPWLQFWEYGIRSMISRNEAGMTYVSIDAQKPTETARFSAKTGDQETIGAGERERNALRVSVTIQGLPAVLFTAKMWFRLPDKAFIRSEMPQGPFAPITIIELCDQE